MRLSLREGMADQPVLVLGQRLPLIGEQFPEPADGMTHDPPEQVVEVLPGVDLAGLAGLDQPEEKGRCPSAALAACEHPVLAFMRSSA
jgi:hypothetical protein